MTETSLIEVEDVVATRGTFQLNVPRWSVPPGSVVGVIGPNGAGKTTLLRLLPGLDDADRGSVRVLGADPIADPAFVRSNLGRALGGPLLGLVPRALSILGLYHALNPFPWNPRAPADRNEHWAWLPLPPETVRRETRRVLTSYFALAFLSLTLRLIVIVIVAGDIAPLVLPMAVFFVLTMVLGAAVLDEDHWLPWLEPRFRRPR